MTYGDHHRRDGTAKAGAPRGITTPALAFIAAHAARPSGWHRCGRGHFPEESPLPAPVSRGAGRHPAQDVPDARGRGGTGLEGTGSAYPAA